MEISKMQELLAASLPIKRYQHSVAVYETALKLAAAHGLAVDKIAIAALLHDCGRQIPTNASVAKANELGIKLKKVEIAQPILLHAILGVYYAREKYQVEDPEILEAIRYHTTGNKGMSDTAMVVFLADMIEPARSFPGIEELRALCYKDLKEAMLLAYSNTINYLINSHLLIHPDCIKGYNQLRLEQLESNN